MAKSKKFNSSSTSKDVSSLEYTEKRTSKREITKTIRYGENISGASSVEYVPLQKRKEMNKIVGKKYDTDHHFDSLNKVEITWNFDAI